MPDHDDIEPEPYDPAEQAMHEDGFTNPRVWLPQQQNRRTS